MPNDTRKPGQEPDKPAALSLRAFLDEPEPEHAWLVPDLLEEQDRLVVTGGEGDGKSTLLRQLAVQAASGIHPFTLEDIEPRRVLLVDFENGRRHLRRELRPLAVKGGHDCAEMLAVEVQPGGCNLDGNPADVGWLAALCESWKAELLVAGPIYKMASGNPNEEQTALAVQRALDGIRSMLGCAVVLEAHTGHAPAGGRRPTRPIGASAWMRWPEFGLHLDRSGALSHWRGARDERDWPPALKRGGEWPWSPETDPKLTLWARIEEFVRYGTGGIPSERTLAAALGRSKTAIHKAIMAHPAEWQHLSSQVREGDHP